MKGPRHERWKLGKAVHVGLTRSLGAKLYSPGNYIAAILERIVEPERLPSKGRTFADMTEEERDAMRRLYERKGNR